PTVASDYLDPSATGARPLRAAERATLASLKARESVEFAAHGLDHRTRHASPRRRSELGGLSNGALDRFLDAVEERLADLGIRPSIVAPAVNRFEAAQYPVLARRYEVVCGGPESVPLLGLQRSPQWRGDAVYLPSYPPLYGSAREVLEG